MGDNEQKAADDGLTPPIEDMRWGHARRHGREGFVRAGDESVRCFVEWGGLRPGDRVLDVGSGVGRMAVALTRYLDVGSSYEGFDVDAEAWAARLDDLRACAGDACRAANGG